MTIYHILNGDCLADQLRQTTINKDFIVCRECLIDGNLNSDDSSEFWVIRAKYIADNYNTSEEEYFKITVKEFEKLKAIPGNSEVCLWFENDLFCQANMWFVVSLLADLPSIKLFRIFPPVNNIADNWNGFGDLNTEMLEQAYTDKKLFTPQDLELGNQLWTAYKNSDFIKLKELSKVLSNCFRYLDEVCQAHIDRFLSDNTLGRPDKVVKEILETMSTNFQDIFLEFAIQQGIYGFGDLQLKIIYDRQLHSN